MKKTAGILWAVFVIFSFLGTDAESATVNVSMGDSFFQPQSITINAGDTVVWTNNGSLFHTTTSGLGCTANMIWDSGFMNPGESFSFTFGQPGTFPYYCSLHCFQGMTGTVTVNPLAQVIPSPAGQQFFSFAAPVSPALSVDPAQARPIGLGAVATGGSAISLIVSLEQFAQPVDIYVLLSLSLDPFTFLNVGAGLVVQTYFITDVIQALASGQPPVGAIPWISNIGTSVSTEFVADLPVSLLAPGRYTFYVLAASPGSLGNFYLWQTETTISP